MSFLQKVTLKWLYSLEIQCHKWFHLKPNVVVINHTEILSFICKGNQFSMTVNFSIVRFILITGRNMNEDHSCLDVTIPVPINDTLISLESNLCWWLHSHIHSSMARRHCLRWNRSQLVSIAVKSGSTYVEQTIVLTFCSLCMSSLGPNIGWLTRKDHGFIGVNGGIPHIQISLKLLRSFKPTPRLIQLIRSVTPTKKLFLVENVQDT